MCDVLTIQTGNGAQSAGRDINNNLQNFYAHIVRKDAGVGVAARHDIVAWPDIWNMDSGCIRFEIPPNDAPELAEAVIRFVVHNHRIRLEVPDVAAWGMFVSGRFAGPPCLGIGPAGDGFRQTKLSHLNVTTIVGGLPAGLGCITSASSKVLADQITSGMDAYLTKALNERIASIWGDKARQCDILSFSLDDELAQLVSDKWTVWNEDFQRTPALFTDFLKLLLGCEQEKHLSAWQIRFGLLTLNPCVIRAIVFCLCVAVGFEVDATPENNIGSNVRLGTHGGHLQGVERVQQRSINQVGSTEFWISDLVILANANFDLKTVRLWHSRLGENPKTRISVHRQACKEQCYITREGGFDAAVADQDITILREWVTAHVNEWLERRRELKESSVKEVMEVIHV